MAGNVDWAALDAMTKAGLSSADIHKLAGTKPQGPAPYTPISNNLPPTSVQPATPPKPGTPTTSPVTGRSIGMSQWGQPMTGALNPEQANALRQSNPDIVNRVTQEATRRFGMAPDYTVIGLANKHINEGASMDDIMELLRRGYGFERDPDLRRAADEVGLEYDSKESVLNRALEEAKRQYERQTGIAEKFRTTHDKSLQSIYRDLQNQLQGVQGRTSSMFQGATQGVDQAYAGAQGGLTEAMQAIQSGMSENAARLGLGEALSDPLSALAAQFAEQSGYIGADRAGDVASMQNLAANELGYQGRLEGIGVQEGAQKRGDLVNEVARHLSELGEGYQSETRDLRGQLSDLGQDRGTALRLAIEDVQNARNDRERQEKLDKLAEEIQRGTLDIQRGELSLQEWEAKNMMQLRMRELDQRIAEFGAGHSLDKEKLQLERQKLQTDMDQFDRSLALDRDKLNSSTDPQRGSTSGYPAVQNFFNSPNKWGDKAGPVFQGTFQGIISEAFAQSQTNPMGEMDPWQVAHTLVEQYPNQDPALMRQAIDIFFGKHGYK